VVAATPYIEVRRPGAALEVLMANKRVETTTSRTAEMTCLSRALSAQESNSLYHGDDYLAPRLLPRKMQALLGVPFIRDRFRQHMTEQGLYQYVIARTRYVDAAMREALVGGAKQVVILGAGFDTRAIRFAALSPDARVFEVDAAPTQQAKLRQYSRRGITPPASAVFVPVDFDRESLAARLEETGFGRGQKCLFIMEGLLMYLQPESVHALLDTIDELAGPGSRIVFDYILEEVVKGTSTAADGADAARTVASVNEQWVFGLEPSQVPAFLAAHGFALVEQRDAKALAALYFSDPAGRVLDHVNSAHCLVTAERA
jgi:methyltransferase (TIGR00027 family)